MSKYPEKCHVNGCPCGYFSSKSPSEPPTTGKGDAEFLVPEPENALEGEYGSGNGIPVTKTAFGFHLDICGVCAPVAEQFPDLELFDHQLCPEGRQLFRNPSAITIPTFDQKNIVVEARERSCLMCDAVRRVAAQVGPLEIKEPCPNVCKGGYFEPPGRIIKKVRSHDANS